MLARGREHPSCAAPSRASSTSIVRRHARLHGLAPSPRWRGPTACGSSMTSTPGKAHALRLGDARRRTFPRLYADADIDLTRRSRSASWSDTPGPAGRARDLTRFRHYDLTDSARPRPAGPAQGPRAVDGGPSRPEPCAGVYCAAARSATVTRASTAFPRRHLRTTALARRAASLRANGSCSSSASSVVRPTTTFGASLRRRVRVRCRCNQELDASGPRPAPERGRAARRALVRVCAGAITLAQWSTRASTLSCGPAIGRRSRWRRLPRGAEVSWGTAVVEPTRRTSWSPPSRAADMDLITQRGFAARSGGRPGSAPPPTSRPGDCRSGTATRTPSRSALRHAVTNAISRRPRYAGCCSTTRPLRGGPADLRGGRVDAVRRQSVATDYLGFRHVFHGSGTARRSSPPRAMPAPRAGLGAGSRGRGGPELPRLAARPAHAVRRRPQARTGRDRHPGGRRPSPSRRPAGGAAGAAPARPRRPHGRRDAQDPPHGATSRTTPMPASS